MTGGPTYEQWAYARRTGRSLKRVASECDLYGHDYQVREREPRLTVTLTGSDPDGGYTKTYPNRNPESVFCSRCGLSWKVER